MTFTMVILWVSLVLNANGQTINHALTSEKIDGYTSKGICEASARDFTNTERPNRIQAIAYCISKG